MLRGRVRALRCLKDDERGAILIYFTVALFALLPVAGAAMDLGHVFLVKQRLTNAADSAALAIGRRPNLTSDQATALLESFIRARYTGNLKSVAVSDTGTQVNVTITVTVPMTFMQVLNTQSVDITVGAAAVRPQGKLEIALVLDQTGSMGTVPPGATMSKIASLKLAAKDLIDAVVWDNQTADYYSKVAIVPYAAGVNVGGSIANTVRGPISLGCLLLGCDRFQFLNFFGGSRTYNISTCVSERTGAQAYTDAAPGPVALVGPNYPPPADPCPSNSITPLTNDKTFLKSQIDLLQAAGSTAGHIGVAWGWYLLSPNWSSVWPSASQPAPYSDLDVLDAMGRPLLRKIIILMTDGDFNTAYCQGVISHDSTSGSDQDHIWCTAPNPPMPPNTPNPPNPPNSSFKQAQTLCANAKSARVIVYTIGFGLPTGPSNARTLMTNCATDNTHAYLAATGDELRQAFREIATRIANLRLTN
jgi:Flp pilus assembly protein TadG